METGNGSKKKHFVVVGGSLGGLATGIALKQAGHNVTILERNATNLLHNQGAGIVAGGDTLDWVKRYDRCGKTLPTTSKRRVYYNRDGEIVHRVDMEQNMTSWDLMYHLMRANFDGVDSDYTLAPESVATDGVARHLHGHKVTGLKEEDGGIGVKVLFETNDGQQHSMTADMVVGADGPSSTVRGFFEPDVKRTYAGYCALRGTVPENETSPAAKDAFCERFAFYHGPGVQILCYLIPGINGTVEPGQRLINFVYYTNFPEGSPELEEILTDKHGRRHRITMPPGLTDPEAWEQQKRVAVERLPPQFAEIVCKTKQPFVQAITDVISPEHEYLNGKVVLIGDALAGFRPHTVASTSQAAFDAQCFADYVDGRISRDEWKKQTLGFARFIQKRGVDMGNRSQHERLSLEEYVADRDRASVPRQEELYPEWATAY